MDTYLPKARFLGELRTARARWDALLAEVDEARMAEPGVAGEWSVKDIVAHVTWGEREIIEVARQHALVGSELWELDQDERNAAVFEENRDRPLPEVLADARNVYRELLPVLEALTEEDLNDPSRFRDMPADWRPWRVFSGNTYEHYNAHNPAIRAWLVAGE